MTGTSVELAWREAGSGEPLLILHGLLGSGRNWSGIARALAAGRRCIMPDLRNHGTSPWADDAGYTAQAADVLALIETLGPAPLDVVGHSMGGKVALTLAAMAPPRVRRLVLVDIAPVAYAVGYADEIDAMIRLDTSSITARAQADAALAGPVPDPVMRGFLLQNLERAGDGWRWRANLAALRGALAEIAGVPPEVTGGGVAVPVAVIRGTRSGYVAADHAEATHRLLPQVSFHDIDGAGHWPHVERPGPFVETLRACFAADAAGRA